MGARTNLRSPSGSTNTRVSLARLLLEREVGQRVPPVQELQQTIGTGSGTVVKALRDLQDSGAVTLKMRGHRGTTVEARHVGRLWNAGQLGNFRVVMPPPWPVEQLGILRAMKDLLSRVGVPLVPDFVAGARARLEAVYHERAHAAITSVGAFSSHHSDLLGMTSLDLGEFTYYARGSLVVIQREGATIGRRPRVGMDPGSYDHQQLTEAEFGQLEPRYLDCSFFTVPANVLAGEIDLAVWHRMPTVIPPELAGLTLRSPATPTAVALIDQLSHAAVVTRSVDAATNAVLREVKRSEIVRYQEELQQVAAEDAAHPILWPS